MKEGLKKFLNPKSIAVVGASDTEGKVGYILMEKLKDFSGKVIPVNIKRLNVFGKKAYKSVKDISEKIDLVLIATPNFTVKKILQDCKKKGVKNVIILTAGFSEIGNYKLQKEILDYANKNKIRLLGPNCFGVANPYLNLDTTFSNSPPIKGDTAFISQSGALWSYVSDSKKNKFSGFVSLGNMIDLDFTDFIEYFNHDNKTKKIILYIEKVKDGKKFIKICRESKKEIIAIKAGQSEKGSEATKSHTASLATDYDIYRGAFKQANIKITDSLIEAFGHKREKVEDYVKSKKVAIITNAGGAGTIITDRLENSKIKVEKITDLLGTATPKQYTKELNKKFYDDFEQVLVILTPQNMSDPEETAKELVRNKNKKKIVACFLGESSMKEAVKILRDGKIPVLTRCC